MHNEDVDQVEDVEVPLKIDSGDIAIEENCKTDSPYTWDVPPVSESVLHQRESASLVRELSDVLWAVDNKNSREELGTKHDSSLVCFSEQVQQPLPSHVLRKSHDLLRIVRVAKQLTQKFQNGDAQLCKAEGRSF